MSKSKRHQRRGGKGENDQDALPQHSRKRKRNIRKKEDRDPFDIPADLDEEFYSDLNDEFFDYPWDDEDQGEHWDDGKGKSRR